MTHRNRPTTLNPRYSVCEPVTVGRRWNTVMGFRVQYVYRSVLQGQMWRTVFAAALVGTTAVWTSTTTALAWDSECVTEQLERELQEYVKLESWQQLFSRHYKFFVDKNGDLFSEGKRLKFNTIIHNVSTSALLQTHHARSLVDVNTFSRSYEIRFWTKTFDENVGKSM